ncbi:MAG: hypothetical protein KGJ32_04880 [Xanthomonadaceae bacterium]|nr:hypothetical protein [Xanthomonadaceae bacterium]
MPDSIRAPIAMLFNGVWSQYAVATAPKYRAFFDLIPVHDLGAERLEGHQALLIPFQSNHAALAGRREAVFGFLAQGHRVAVFGDAADWIGGQWEDRPVDNSWWTRLPAEPPIAWTDFSHPLFAGLTPRQAGWHHHGAYTRIPAEARILQRSRDGEVVCWETHAHGGTLLAATSDPVIEHGVQQIRHLDHFVDQLVFWLCGRRPDPVPLTFSADQFGHAPVPQAAADPARHLR